MNSRLGFQKAMKSRFGFHYKKEKGFTAANYVTRVINLNRVENEEIIETITLHHQQR